MSHQPLPTLPAERRATIARMVSQHGKARVADLVAQLGVHPATIRRDLTVLEQQGALRRVHGGAVAIDKAMPEGPCDSARTQETRIGQAAAKMIADGETVFLDAGNLSREVARCLVMRSRLTIITNGLEVANWVATHTSHTLIVTGGQVEGRDRALVGHLTRAALSGLRADHVVMELDGVSAVGGLTDDSLQQAEITRLLLKLGTQVIVLVPVERVGRVAAAYIAPASDADVVVTAREAPSPVLWDLSQAGVGIVLA